MKRILFLFVLVILLSSTVFAVKVDKTLEKEFEKANKFSFFNNNEVDVIIRYKNSNEFYESNRNLKKIKFSSKKINLSELNDLKSNEEIEGIYYNWPMKLHLSDSVNIINASKLHSLKVDDFNITGKDYTVCILDTGIDYSLDYFNGRYLGGYDFINNDSDTMDDNGHGTHVAGIVGSNGNLIGVAPTINIVAVKVLDSNGDGTADDILKGIQWCIDNASLYNISVITMSLGCGSFSSYCDSETNCNADLFSDVIADAVANDISVIVSTGNDGSTTNIGVPSCIENATSVGATTKSDNFYPQGNRNNITDLVAPGSSIQSLKSSSSGCLCNDCSNGFMTCSGTSMSTPHVAAAYVLLKQYLRDENGTVLNPYQLNNLFNKTGDFLFDSGTGLNFPRINLYNALLEVDNEIPFLQISSPLNSTYTKTNLSLNYIAKDTTLETIWYEFNNVNITLTENTTLNVSAGDHVLKIYANDSAGNLNSVDVSFSIAPIAVILVSPNDDFMSDSESVTFNCSASSNISLINISFWHDLSGDFILNQTLEISGLENNSFFTLNNLNDNVNITWNCLIYNMAELYDWGINRTLFIRLNDNPVVISYLPNTSILTINEQAILSFNQTSYDVDGDNLYYYWYVNSVLNTTNENFNFASGYSGAGTYNITFIVSDGNLSNSVEWNLTVTNSMYCGNDIKEASETCDGSDLEGVECTDLGYDGGSLSCSSCSYDESACITESNGGSDGSDSSGSSGGSGGGGTPINEFGNEDIDSVQVSSEETIVEEPIIIPITGEVVEEKFSANTEEKTKELGKNDETPKKITGLSTFKQKAASILSGVVGLIVLVSVLWYVFSKDWKFKP